jgi:hypothetical protein
MPVPLVSQGVSALSERWRCSIQLAGSDCSNLSSIGA